MKKALRFCIMTALLITMLALSAHAAEIVDSGFCGGEGDGSNLTWTLDSEGTLRIEGVGRMREYFDYQGSYAPWYDLRTSIKKVVISDGVSSIGEYSFFNCSNLTSATIAESVDSIGSCAFERCTSFANVVFPERIVSIESGVLKDTAWYDAQPDGVIYLGKRLYSYKGEMPRETEIVVKPGTVAICGAAFQNYKNLVGITLPEGITIIGDFAFNLCTNLANITFPESIISVGGYSFYDTAWYNAQPDGAIYLGKCLYKYKGEVPSGAYVIKQGTVMIGGTAFYKCKSLIRVSIPSSVTSIGYSAFADCENLRDITIPDSVTYIGSAAFVHCDSLTDVFIPNSVKNINSSVFAFCENLVNATFQNGVKDIGNDTFTHCTNLKNVSIPDGVTTIGGGTFAECTNLESITMPNSVTSIGFSAFLRCKSLTSVIMSQRVVSIGGYAFSNCTELSNIQIPDGVTYIGEHAFLGTAWYDSYPDGTVVYIGNCLYSIKGITSSEMTVVVKPGTQTICESSFNYRNGIFTIYIPSSVTNINDKAFSNCQDLREIHYDGTKFDWEKISIGTQNELLLLAKMYYSPKPLPVLSTDIRSYVFGSEIESYNVNGSTCIVAEDLMNYGFTVVWDGNARTLSITHPSDDFTQAEKKNLGAKSGSIGEKLTETVPTDIVTYVNGEEVQSYNIGGKTVIYIDALGVFGGVTWDGDARTISVG
mgnify:CR=1 FL=1